MQQIFDFMKTLDVRPLLPNIQCPTLVIHFSGDLAVPVRMGRDMAEAIPNAEFLEAITAQLDQTQDALRLKAVNRPLTFALS